jgi:hypothetical protein
VHELGSRKSSANVERTKLTTLTLTASNSKTTATPFSAIGCNAECRPALK